MSLLTECRKHIAHQDCPIPRVVLEWLFGDDTGSSSEAIVRHYYGFKKDVWWYPFDASDFGRCYRMLKLFPWMGVEHMRNTNEVWDLMAQRWGLLTALYEEALQAEKTAWRVDDALVKANNPNIKHRYRSGQRAGWETDKWNAAVKAQRDLQQRGVWKSFRDALNQIRSQRSR